MNTITPACQVIDEMNELLDSAITVRVKKEASARRQLRALTGHLETGEYRVLIEIVNQRYNFLLAKIDDGVDISGWDLQGPFALSYAAISAGMQPRRHDSSQKGISMQAIKLAADGLVKHDLISRSRQGLTTYHWHLNLLAHNESYRVPIEEQARSDVRDMISESRLTPTQAAVLVPLRYLAEDGKLFCMTPEQLEDATGVNRKTIIKTLQETINQDCGLDAFYQVSRGAYDIEFSRPRVYEPQIKRAAETDQHPDYNADWDIPFE